jgi:hypothetical protein
LNQGFLCQMSSLNEGFDLANPFIE